MVQVTRIEKDSPVRFVSDDDNLVFDALLTMRRFETWHSSTEYTISVEFNLLEDFDGELNQHTVRIDSGAFSVPSMMTSELSKAIHEFAEDLLADASTEEAYIFVLDVVDDVLNHYVNEFKSRNFE